MSWYRGPYLTQTKQYHTCSLVTLPDGTTDVVVVGGYSSSCKYQKDVDIINLDKNTIQKGKLFFHWCTTAHWCGEIVQYLTLCADHFTGDTVCLGQSSVILSDTLQLFIQLIESTGIYSRKRTSSWHTWTHCLKLWPQSLYHGGK